MHPFSRSRGAPVKTIRNVRLGLTVGCWWVVGNLILYFFFVGSQTDILGIFLHSIVRGSSVCHVCVRRADSYRFFLRTCISTSLRTAPLAVCSESIAFGISASLARHTEQHYWNLLCASKVCELSWVGSKRSMCLGRINYHFGSDMFYFSEDIWSIILLFG